MNSWMMIFFAIVFQGCALLSDSVRQDGDIVVKRLRRRVIKLEEQLYRERSAQRELQEENEYLKKEILESSSEKKRLPEAILYRKVLELSRSGDLLSLEKVTELLLKGYPKSAYVDDALYLSGTLALFKGDSVKAQRYLDEIIEKYPLSNRKVSALYGKAMLQNKLGKFDIAKRTMELVVSSYPGSPESTKAVQFMR